jgi:hypothetical protein
MSAEGNSSWREELDLHAILASSDGPSGKWRFSASSPSFGILHDYNLPSYMSSHVMQICSGLRSKPKLRPSLFWYSISSWQFLVSSTCVSSRPVFYYLFMSLYLIFPIFYFTCFCISFSFHLSRFFTAFIRIFYILFFLLIPPISSLFFFTLSSLIIALWIKLSVLMKILYRLSKMP